MVLDVPDIRLARNVFALLLNGKRTAQVQLFTELLADTLHGSTGPVRAGSAPTMPKTTRKSTPKQPS